ncbi:MAG: phytoene desaturase family protein [Clostridium sp.]
MENIIIVGSGIGGLCSAVRLLKKKFKVTILEKENYIGGKVNIKKCGDFNFDLTASILMTPHTYTDIFTSSGRDYRDYFELINLDPIYNVFYSDGAKYSFSSNLKKTINELEKIEDRLPLQFERFLYKTLNKYWKVNNKFLNRPMIKCNELINFDSIKTILKLDPFKTSDSYISKFIDNEKIREYLNFQSMYMGVDPYTNSNLYTMIPAISHAYGFCYIKGGVYKYICALEKLIYELGGNIKINTEVKEIVIKNGRAVGVKTDKEFYKSDIVICNADYPYAVENLIDKNINKELIRKFQTSCSVFIIYLGLGKKYDNLNVHNIFINSKFKDSIQKPFKGDIPYNPSIYMYYPCAVDDGICISSKSVLNIMVRVPDLYHKNIKWDKSTILRLRNRIIKEITGIEGLESLERYIEVEEYLTPQDIERMFYAYKGSAFGLSHKLTQSIYFRPHMKSKKVKGLFFIGSSTHPGNGVSIIIEGTKVLTDIICREYKI